MLAIEYYWIGFISFDVAKEKREKKKMKCNTNTNLL